MPGWFPYADLFCSALAAGLWMVWPGVGFWPLLIGLAPWAFRWWQSGRPSHRTTYDIPIVVFLLTAGVSVWAAYDQPVAHAKFWLIVGAVLLFYAYANWAIEGRSGTYRRQAWTLAILGAATSIYFIATHDWDIYPEKIDILVQIGKLLQVPLPRFPADLLHPNVVGAILGMLVPFAGAVALISWDRRNWLELGTSVALLFITLGGLLLTITRGAWVALICATLLVLLWPISGWISQKNPRQRRYWFFGIPFAILCIAFAVFALWPNGIEKIVASLPASETGIKRADLYTNSWMLVNDYPIIGSGLGGYMMLYSTYALLTHVGFSTHGHNLYLDVIIEQGLLALVILTWMWLLMGEAVWRALEVKRVRRSPSEASQIILDEHTEPDQRNWQRKAKTRQGLLSSQRIVLGAAAMSLVVLLVGGLVDDAIYNSRAILLLFLPLSFSVPILRRAEVPSRRRQLQVIAVAAAVVFIVLIIWWRPLLSMGYSNLAAVQQSRAELGAYIQSDYPIQDAVRREIDLSPVMAGYERALLLNSQNSSANRRLGQIELSLGRYEDALRHLMQAYESRPGENATRQLLGEALIVNGRIEEGMVLWSTVPKEQGQLDLRRFWYKEIGDQVNADRIYQVLNQISS